MSLASEELSFAVLPREGALSYLAKPHMVSSPGCSSGTDGGPFCRALLVLKASGQGLAAGTLPPCRYHLLTERGYGWKEKMENGGGGW